MCRICENTEELNAHHIIPFSYLRDRIILENSNFLDLNTKEGRIEILELCTSDWRINDIDNGITLCKRCHNNLHKSLKIFKDEEIYTYYVKIIKVIDGDTIIGEIDLGFNTYKTETFRLYGINSEELTSNDIHLKGKALHTKEILKEILEKDRILKLATHKSGKYGRYLATVILDNIDLNKYLIDTGVVRTYKY